MWGCSDIAGLARQANEHPSDTSRTPFHNGPDSNCLVPRDCHSGLSQATFTASFPGTGKEVDGGGAPTEIPLDFRTNTFAGPPIVTHFRPQWHHTNPDYRLKKTLEGTRLWERTECVMRAVSATQIDRQRTGLGGNVESALRSPD